jgi:hypothetical protein
MPGQSQLRKVGKRDIVDSLIFGRWNYQAEGLERITAIAVADGRNKKNNTLSWPLHVCNRCHTFDLRFYGVVDECNLVGYGAM